MIELLLLEVKCDGQQSLKTFRGVRVDSVNDSWLSFLCVFWV